MNWFKRIFCSQEEFNGYVDQWGLPSVEDTPPMPKVKPPKAEKDISEPIYVMVQSMLEQPHRWKIKRVDKLVVYPFEHYLVKDIKTKLGFYIDVLSSFSSSSLSWITDDELEYLISNLRAMHELKMLRVERVRQVKKNIERDKVKELYK